MKFHGDWLPERMERFRCIEGVFRKTCLTHGFGEVRTPIIEKLHWFTGAGILSPDLMHKVYSFLDWDGWSGERVVLRPDNTVPVCRLFAEHFASQKKARLFYVEDVFRYESAEKSGGRRCQMGVEILGDFSHPNAHDTEALALLLDFLNALKPDNTRLVLGHAGILHAWLKTLGLSDKEELDAFDLLMEGRLEELQKLCDGRGCMCGLNRLLELEGSSSAFLANLKALGHESAGFCKAVEDLEEVASCLEALGINFEINTLIQKDLTYYTGLMFDIYVNGAKVGGGGRYDNLLSKFPGEAAGGCGFCLYVEPLMAALAAEASDQDPCPGICLAADLGKRDEFLAAMNLASLLRSRGARVQLSAPEDLICTCSRQGILQRRKNGFDLSARSGGGEKIFPLPLGDTGLLLEFWGMCP